MEKEEIIKKLKRLAEQIEYHNNLYYNNDSPEISDAEYDNLRIKNTELEKQFPNLVLPNSPSNKVGAELKSSFKKVQHLVPMLSLGNTFTKQDVENYINKTKRFLQIDSNSNLEFLAEPKIDGLSATLIYKNGKLVLGATREGKLMGMGWIGLHIAINTAIILIPDAGDSHIIQISFRKGLEGALLRSLV